MSDCISLKNNYHITHIQYYSTPLIVIYCIDTSIKYWSLYILQNWTLLNKHLAVFVTSDILSFHRSESIPLCLVSLDYWSLLNEKMTDIPVFTSSWMKPTLKDLKTISHQWLKVVQCETNGDCWKTT